MILPRGVVLSILFVSSISFAGGNSPSQQHVAIHVLEDTVYHFKKEDFLNGYKDPNGKPATHILISSLFSATASLQLNGFSVRPNQHFPVDELDNMTVVVNIENYNGVTLAGFSLFNGEQLTNPANLKIIYEAVNDPPQLIDTPIGQKAELNKVFSYKISENVIYDPDKDDVIRFNLASGPSWLSFDKDSSVLFGKPTLTDRGEHTVIVIASDLKGEAVEIPLQIKVAGANLHPINKRTGNMKTEVYEVNKSIDYKIPQKFVDLEYEQLGYRFENVPGWLSLDFSNGIFQGSANNANTGLHRSSMIVFDKEGGFNKDEFIVKVRTGNSTPNQKNIKLILPQKRFSRGEYNDTYNFSRTDFSEGFSDSDGNNLGKLKVTSLPNSAATLYYGSTKLTTDIEIDVNDVSRLRAKFKHGFIGPVSFLFQTSDGASWSNQASFTIVITDHNIPPISRHAGHKFRPFKYYASENQTFGLSVRFGFYDLDGDDLTYAVSGDLPKGLFLKNASLKGIPAIGTSGQYLVRIHASDAHGDSTWSDMLIEVTSENRKPSCNNQRVSLSHSELLQTKINGMDDSTESLIYSFIKLPKHGDIVFFDNDSGQFSYKPNPGFQGADELMVKVDDGSLYGTCKINIRVN